LLLLVALLLASNKGLSALLGRMATRSDGEEARRRRGREK
jgi:hypothetical protein